MTAPTEIQPTKRSRIQSRTKRTRRSRTRSTGIGARKWTSFRQAPRFVAHFFRAARGTSEARWSFGCGSDRFSGATWRETRGVLRAEAAYVVGLVCPERATILTRRRQGGCFLDRSLVPTRPRPRRKRAFRARGAANRFRAGRVLFRAEMPGLEKHIR